MNVMTTTNKQHICGSVWNKLMDLVDLVALVDEEVFVKKDLLSEVCFILIVFPLTVSACT